MAAAFRREVKKYHLDQLLHMEQFEHTFKQALELAEIDRLIVFVDDLDRCLPEKAIEVLEAIKLFLEVRGRSSCSAWTRKSSSAASKPVMANCSAPVRIGTSAPSCLFAGGLFAEDGPDSLPFAAFERR